VELSADQTTTEIFKGVSVTDAQGGPGLVAGQELRVHVDYSQPYAHQIDVQCDLMNASGATKVADLSVQALPANPIENIPTAIVKNYKDEVTPTTGTLELIAFAPADPGTYMVRCFTQEDDNNDIERTITIGAAPDQPTP
jgi:hypothetical protein